MQIVFLINPYSIYMYSYKNNLYEFLGCEDFLTIEEESNEDYENRAIYVCKDICQDFVKIDLYKKNRKEISNIKIILTNPWCIYDVMDLEKKFDKSERIDQRFVDKMVFHKEVPGISILKNSIFNISLNGYSVQKVNNQLVNKVEVQYISIYSSSNFLHKLKNTVETIFHLHNVEIDSIYSLINDKNNEIENNDNMNQLKIIIEDQGVDLSYIYQNKNISNFFSSFSVFTLRSILKESLNIDDNILDKILRSKVLNLENNKELFVYDKTLNNIWLDLDPNVKNKINQIIYEQLEKAKVEIRKFLDNTDGQFMDKGSKINIYCIDEDSLNTIGLIFADSLKEDVYILGKLLTDKTNIFTKKIF